MMRFDSSPFCMRSELMEIVLHLTAPPNVLSGLYSIEDTSLGPAALLMDEICVGFAKRKGSWGWEEGGREGRAEGCHRCPAIWKKIKQVPHYRTLQCSLEVATEPAFLMSWELKRCQSLPRPLPAQLGHWEVTAPHSPGPHLTSPPAFLSHSGPLIQRKEGKRESEIERHHAGSLSFSSGEGDNAFFVPRIQRNYVC